MDTKRSAGLALIGLAVLLAVASLGLWQWEHSDSQENAREVEALTGAFSGRAYIEAEPDLTFVYVLGGGAALMFLSGIILVAASPPGQSAS